jgi:Ca2+-binding RTX toxin-like protein
MATFTAGTAAFNMQTAINQINTQITLDDLVSIDPSGTNQVWLAGSNYFNLKFTYTVGTGGDYSFNFTRFALLNTANSAGTYKWSMDGSLLKGSFSQNISSPNSEDWTLTINVPGLVSGTVSLFHPDPTALEVNAGASFSTVFLRGNDTVIGKGGNDVLMGGAGHDTITGGGGADKFVFEAKPIAGNSDHIVDFVHGTDKIQFDNADFKTIGANGALSSDAFFLGTAAHDPSDRIIYDKAHGALYYDSDGTGSAIKVLIATLDNHATVSLSDMQVI